MNQQDRGIQTVWKYEISLRDSPTVLGIPDGARILHVDDQHGIPTLWMLVNPDTPTVTRQFIVTGTGHLVPPSTYIGTAVGPIFVWHIWELDDKDPEDRI